MKSSRILLGTMFLFAVVMLQGCAGTGLTGTAEMSKQISIPAAAMLQAQGVSEITTTIFQLNTVLVGAEGAVQGGEFQVVGYTKAGERIDGFVFLDDISPLCVLVGMPVIFAELPKARDAKFVYLSKDKQRCFTPSGKEISSFKPGIQKKDEELKHFVFANGENISEVNGYWIKYFNSLFKPVAQDEDYAAQMTLAEYKKYTEGRFKTFAKTPDGVRLTGYSQQEFEEIAAKNPKTTVFQRFFKHLAISPAVISDFGASAVANAGIQAYFDRTPEGLKGAALQPGWSVGDRVGIILQMNIDRAHKLRELVILAARAKMIKAGMSEKMANRITDELFQEF